MFDSVKFVLNYLINWWAMIADNLLNGMGYIGVSLIGFILLRKVIDVWRKVK